MRSFTMHYIRLLLAVVLLEKVCTEDVTTNGTSGFGYELLLAKMDYLEYKFLEMQVELKEQGEDSKRAILEQTSDILEQQKSFANKELLMKSIFELRPRKHPSDNSKLIDCLVQHARKNVQKAKIVSCALEPSKKSGTYLLELNDSISFEVYCEQELHGGGWLVFQNRFNGSVDFYKKWNDYKEGFGSLDGEFWLGLDKIQKITSVHASKLLVYLENLSGTSKYALYDQFGIKGEDKMYELNILNGYSGTAGDSLAMHKGHKFTTYDSDNDEYSGNCASDRQGAWWYYACMTSNLNGAYKHSATDKTMSWDAFSGSRESLKVSKMMIKY